MDDARAYLQSLLREEIPLTGALGLRVAAYDGAALTLAAPIAPNLNHKRTVFGGSLYSVLVLAGWGLLTLKLREAGVGAQIVIHEAYIRYHLPVETDFEAVCTLPAADTYEGFLRTLRRRARARIQLAAQVRAGAREAVGFSGSYVAYGGS